MKTLLLTSAGMQVKEEILKILPKPPSQVKLAHIITASKPEPDTSYVRKDVETMQELGFQTEDIDIEGKSEAELRELLSGFDVIYVQGGNTFYLLKCARESGFDKAVKALIGRGIIYIGVSAGSIITGPNIETSGWDPAWDTNDVNLQDLTGLNLIPFAVVPHFERKDRSVYIERAKQVPYAIRYLTDDQAFLVQDGKVTLIGTGEEIKI